MKIPEQLHGGESLIRSWSVNHPCFYGERTDHFFVDRLLEAETRLMTGEAESIDPMLCRVLAAYHGPKGAKVPLSVSTVSGCVRPAFVEMNNWIRPNTPSCYGGGCYLFHARAVPAKKGHEVKVRAHKIPAEGLLAAARLARHFGLPIRDNQSSDGSLSMALPRKGGSSSQMLSNLRILNKAGYSDVLYLCFSSCYVCLPDDLLRGLAEFPNLIVHITVSGWHSREENALRLAEFERYADALPSVCLRVVNRQDWASPGGEANDGAAQCEDWLLDEIVRRGLAHRLIRTPFHSVHPFPGSHTGQLGSRHLAGIKYSATWQKILPESMGECCTTGKCKSCSTKCGIRNVGSRAQEPIIAARAYRAMLCFEAKRQVSGAASPLALYTARMLARKSMDQYNVAGDSTSAFLLAREYARWDQECSRANLTPLQRRRLSNDCHALVVDGLDRHGLWRNSRSAVLAGREASAS